MTEQRPGDNQTDPAQAKLEAAMQHIKHRIVVFSGKGGVGKTTVSVNLAVALGELGFAVGLFDADVTGPNVARMTGASDPTQVRGERALPHLRHGLHVVSLATMLPPDAPVIWRGPMRSRAIEQLLTETLWDDVDTLVTDLPPGTGDEVLTVVQRVRPQVAVIVTTPQSVARGDARRAIGFAKKLDIPSIGVVENMSGLVCPHCGESIELFGANTTQADAQALDVDHFGVLPMDPLVPGESDEGAPAVLTRPHSAWTGAVRQIARAVAERLQPGR